MTELPAISVAQFLSLVNQTLRNVRAEQFCIEGEVADFKISQGKWVNFDLKDEEIEQKISCFMTVYQLGQPLESGMRIRVTGYPKVFERFGKFSLNIESVTLVGEGALAKAYALLKTKLTDEGLFALERKRSLPRFPQVIGLITSKEAAAYGDFLRILSNRIGGLTILHASVHVQGQFAVNDICAAFQQFNQLPVTERPEVIVLTRGGGSLEDLHAFNDERVVRAVFGSEVPVVVGVGHERDESLCDFVADFRASTPSNAAECLWPNGHDLRRYLVQSEDRLQDRFNAQVRNYQLMVERSVMLFERTMIEVGNRLRSGVINLSYAFDRFRLSLLATREHIERQQQIQLRNFAQGRQALRDKLLALSRVLDSVNPKKVLARGYAIARLGKRIITDPTTLATGDRFSLQFLKGELQVEVSGLDKQKKLF